MTSLITVALAVICLLGPLPTAAWLRPLASRLDRLPQINLPTAAVPVARNSSQPSLGAASVYAVDADSWTQLYAKDPDAERPIASITKIVTALVILRDHSLDESITVPQLPPYDPADAKLGLVPGEQFKLGDLLKAALIPSDNDAAEALALYDSGTISAFTGKMNGLAADWGISRTHFVSANGLVDQDNYATAANMARFADIALHNPDFARLTATQTASISDLDGRVFRLNTTNQLLGSDARVSGIKTGYTEAAGQSVVTLATIHGHRIITVILGSQDRFGETTTLLNWIERTYQWQ